MKAYYSIRSGHGRQSRFSSTLTLSTGRRTSSHRTGSEWPALLIGQLQRWVPLTPSGFGLFTKAAHRTQRIALAFQFVMEDITKDKTRRRERVQGMEHHTFQEPACVQLSRRFRSPVLLTVHGRLIVQALMIKSSAIDLSAQPLASMPSPEIQ